MRITYDAEADAVYIYLSEIVKEPDTREVDDDIALDFDEQERLMGIEILEASKRLDLDYMLPMAERLVLSQLCFGRNSHPHSNSPP